MKITPKPSKQAAIKRPSSGIKATPSGRDEGAKACFRGKRKLY
jgi:hypothetical protein